VDAVGERIQNLIQIVAMEIDIFGALRPEDRHFGAMVGDKEDVDAVRVAVVLAAIFAVFIVVFIVVVAVTTALNNDGIGLNDLVSRLIARQDRRGGLEAS
jgi:K+-transporting ATPase A subunit